MEFMQESIVFCSTVSADVLPNVTQRPQVEVGRLADAVDMFIKGQSIVLLSILTARLRTLVSSLTLTHLRSSVPA